MTDSRRGKKQNQTKHPYAREQWMKRKKQGRPKQVFIDTNQFMSLDEIDKLTDAQVLALPKPHWEKVSA